jgi:hypothetical protein
MNFLNQLTCSILEQLLQVLDLSLKKSDLLVTMFSQCQNDMLFEQDLTLNFFWVLKRDRRKKRLEATAAHVCRVGALRLSPCQFPSSSRLRGPHPNGLWCVQGVR